jgi:hypothetical protein
MESCDTTYHEAYRLGDVVHHMDHIGVPGVPYCHVHHYPKSIAACYVLNAKSSKDAGNWELLGNCVLWHRLTGGLTFAHQFTPEDKAAIRQLQNEVKNHSTHEAAMHIRTGDILNNDAMYSAEQHLKQWLPYSMKEMPNYRDLNKAGKMPSTFPCPRTLWRCYVAPMEEYEKMKFPADIHSLRIFTNPNHGPNNAFSAPSLEYLKRVKMNLDGRVDLRGKPIVMQIHNEAGKQMSHEENAKSADDDLTSAVLDYKYLYLGTGGFSELFGAVARKLQSAKVMSEAPRQKAHMKGDKCVCVSATPPSSC